MECLLYSSDFPLIFGFAGELMWLISPKKEEKEKRLDLVDWSQLKSQAGGLFLCLKGQKLQKVERHSARNIKLHFMFPRHSFALITTF